MTFVVAAGVLWIQKVSLDCIGALARCVLSNTRQYDYSRKTARRQPASTSFFAIAKICVQFGNGAPWFLADEIFEIWFSPKIRKFLQVWKALTNLPLQGTATPPFSTVTQIGTTVGPTVQYGGKRVRRRGLY